MLQPVVGPKLQAQLSMTLLAAASECQAALGPAYLGTSWARSLCVGACRLTASVLCSLASASLLIALGTPTVEIVILRKPLNEPGVHTLLHSCSSKPMSCHARQVWLE